MRKLSLVTLALIAAVPSLASAAPPKCDPASKTAVDCLRDDVLIISGDSLAPCTVTKTTTDPMTMMATTTTTTSGADCPQEVWVSKAVDRAVEVIKANGGVPDDQWDQLVVFGQQMAAAKDPSGPLFYREGYREDMTGVISSGVNEVANIGLEVNPRVPGRPFVGYISAGSAGQPGATPWAGTFGPCGKAPKKDTDTPTASAAKALCYPGFYNYFDALAQATGAIFGPYLKGSAMEKLDSPLSVYPALKPGLVTVDGKTGVVSSVGDQAVKARIWNSLVNMKGSIFAGNNFRDNGNGTFETTKPTPYYGINVPFSAGWKAGTSLSGSQILRFQPLDLYIMGLLPLDAVPDLLSFQTASAAQVYRPATNAYGAAIGPMMGLRNAVAIRSNGAPLTRDAIRTANGGERMPDANSAPHYLKQLWVLVLKPADLLESGAKIDPMTMQPDPKDVAAMKTAADQQIDMVVAWRHQFAAYYYMLTGYRGRVVTTFDGKIDDNAYFEFGQPADDKAMFAADSDVEVEFNGPEPVQNSSEIKSVMRFLNTPGGTAGVHTTGMPLGLRIEGSQSANTTPNNSIAVRMRLPPGAPKKAYATLTFDNGPSIRLPSSCGTPARAGCTEAAFLIPDGNWRTYSATLSSNEEFTNGSFTGFSFSPSDQPYQGEGIEVEFIRVANVPSPKDSDLQCVTCGHCNNLKVKDSIDACNKLCKDKSEGTVVNAPLPDGWIDSEDNCPAVYNPLQEDGNADGVGDACEDFDGDGVINHCDNCPTVTNSRQRDNNANGIGDVCDGSSGSSCFFQPGTLAGPVSAAPGALLGVLGAGAIGLLAFRRRRKSR